MELMLRESSIQTCGGTYTQWKNPGRLERALRFNRRAMNRHHGF